jgi:putative heme iron utilization protein
MAGFADLAASARTHVNQDHADAIRCLVSKLPQGRADDWRVTSIDPDGVLLEAAGETKRIDFGCVVLTADELRAAFVRLVQR